MAEVKQRFAVFIGVVDHVYSHGMLDGLDRDAMLECLLGGGSSGHQISILAPWDSYDAAKYGCELVSAQEARHAGGKRIDSWIIELAGANMAAQQQITTFIEKLMSSHNATYFTADCIKNYVNISAEGYFVNATSLNDATATISHADLKLASEEIAKKRSVAKN